jgi:hypothetical protein
MLLVVPKAHNGSVVRFLCDSIGVPYRHMGDKFDRPCYPIRILFLQLAFSPLSPP